jgi:prepilin-type N-terminal cleavage/methylation domain-containing protein
MKKGFTLIELMAAILILGVISLIAIPLVEQILTEIGNDSYTSQIKNIRAGARQWAAEDMNRLPEDNSNTTITLLTLQQAGFVKKDLYNPRTKELFEGSLSIVIESKNGNYIYYVGSESDGQLNPNAPRIGLVGSSLVYVNQNAIYTELGVVVKDGNGNVIASPSLTTVITNSSGTVIPSIPTNTLGTYTISYSVTTNGIVARTARTVIVRDNVPPVLTLTQTSITIPRAQTTFNFNSYASATDASPVFITISTNLTLGIPGKYIVTYTATDSSGNQTVRDMQVTISY